MTIGQFLAMGGYARYVWPCFALAISVLLWNVWSARRYHAAGPEARAARRGDGGE